MTEPLLRIYGNINWKEIYFFKKIGKFGSFPSYCNNECPQECDSEEFSFTLSTSKFPTDIYQNIVLDKLSKSPLLNFSKVNIEKDVALVKIYFDELKYTLIDQIPKMDTESLISSIGGSLGLFMGLSICSFMELLELLWIVITFKK